MDRILDRALARTRGKITRSGAVLATDPDTTVMEVGAAAPVVRGRTKPAAFALLAALLAALTPAPAAAGCPEQFAGGAEPASVNPRLATRARELCYRGYAVLHSGATRTPLWSAEHLTAERVEAARGVRRTNLFHAEERLPPGERAELADYARSGYDRGHMKYPVPDHTHSRIGTHRLLAAHSAR